MVGEDPRCEAMQCLLWSMSSGGAGGDMSMMVRIRMMVVRMWTTMMMVLTMVMMNMITCAPRYQALVKDDDGDDDGNLCPAVVGLGQRVKLLLASCVPEHQTDLGNSSQQSVMTLEPYKNISSITIITRQTLKIVTDASLNVRIRSFHY